MYVVCDKTKLVGVLFKKEHSTGLMTPARPQQSWYVSALPGVLIKAVVSEHDGHAGTYAEGALFAFADVAHKGMSACRLAAPDSKADDNIKQSMPWLLHCSQGQLSLLGWAAMQKSTVCNVGVCGQIRWTGLKNLC